MKHISTEGGRATRIYVSDEIRPENGIFLPNLIADTASRYLFATIPEVPKDSKGGLRFGEGQMFGPEQPINIKSLGIFNDGIIVEASNTDLALLVVEDFEQWATEKFSFRKPITKPIDAFDSVLVVEFPESFEKHIDVFGKIGREISRSHSNIYDLQTTINLTGLTFGNDQTKISPSMNAKQASFTIARRVDRPFEENRYFCTASLTTKEHINLLEKIEKIILD